MALPYQLHTGRELEMMLAGTKPLAMFYDYAEAEPNEEIIPEQTFDRYVREGKFVKKTFVEELAMDPRTGRPVRVRYVLYALAKEAWRLEAMQLLQETMTRMGSTNEVLDRMTGSLLGYSHEENDAYIASKVKKDKK
jgi:hypothetical protein